MSFKNFDSQAVDVVVNNIPITDGKPQGTFLSVSADQPQWGVTQSLDAHVVRWRQQNRLWTVELTLLQTSRHNQELSVMFAADYNATNGAGVGTFLVLDNNGATKLAAAHCWIEQPPDWAYAAEVQEVTWTFKVVADPHTMIFGGN